jgi:hypothetical protein
MPSVSIEDYGTHIKVTFISINSDIFFAKNNLIIQKDGNENFFLKNNDLIKYLTFSDVTSPAVDNLDELIEQLLNMSKYDEKRSENYSVMFPFNNNTVKTLSATTPIDMIFSIKFDNSFIINNCRLLKLTLMNIQANGMCSWKLVKHSLPRVYQENKVDLGTSYEPTNEQYYIFYNLKILSPGLTSSLSTTEYYESAPFHSIVASGFITYNSITTVDLSDIELNDKNTLSASSLEPDKIFNISLFIEYLGSPVTVYGSLDWTEDPTTETYFDLQEWFSTQTTYIEGTQVVKTTRPFSINPLINLLNFQMTSVSFPLEGSFKVTIDWIDLTNSMYQWFFGVGTGYFEATKEGFSIGVENNNLIIKTYTADGTLILSKSFNDLFLNVNQNQVFREVLIWEQNKYTFFHYQDNNFQEPTFKFSYQLSPAESAIGSLGFTTRYKYFLNNSVDDHVFYKINVEEYFS